MAPAKSGTKMAAPGPTIFGVWGAAGPAVDTGGAALLAARARLSRASHSGQSACFAEDDLKCLPQRGHFIFTLLITHLISLSLNDAPSLQRVKAV